MKLRLVFLAVVTSFAAACASIGTFAGGSEGEVTYASTAEENMQRGDEAMKSRNYAEAASFFEFVKTKFPFLEIAKTAELRLGDADFERERFVEARDRYLNFVRLHPTHPKLDYAAFRAALTHYKEIPSDFFILPPASEKDQVEVRNALSAMSDFVRNHPGSEHQAEAKKVISEVKLRLAEHELYVAEFYAKRERWAAVVTRLNVVARDFSGIGLDERAAFGLHDAYVKLKDYPKARAALETYVQKFPDEPGAKKAKEKLSELPAALPESAPDAGS